MGYVNLYAQHKAKTLEQGLWEVMGVGDVLDITDEVVNRCGLRQPNNKTEQQPHHVTKTSADQQAEAS